MQEPPPPLRMMKTDESVVSAADGNDLPDDSYMLDGDWWWEVRWVHANRCRQERTRPTPPSAAYDEDG